MIRIGSKCWLLDSEVILNHFSWCLPLIAVIWLHLKYDIFPVPVKKPWRIWSNGPPESTNYQYHNYNNTKLWVCLWYIIWRPRQNARHFTDDIFKCIFLNENIWLSIKTSLNFVPKHQINNIPSLVQIIAWRRSGDKPLCQPMMASLLTHICITRPQCDVRSLLITIIYAWCLVNDW